MLESVEEAVRIEQPRAIEAVLADEGVTVRVQEVNGDRVLEITEEVPVKTRVSEAALLRKKAYLEASIGRFQAELAETETGLAMLHEEARG